MGGKPRLGRAFAVGQVFESYAEKPRRRLLTLRQLIYDTAAEIDVVGPLEETLKWGEPAYLTPSGSGSTIRLGWKKADPDRYFLYFNCQTSLVDMFRGWFSEHLAFEGNRAIAFNVDESFPTPVVAQCIEAALTYHVRKR